VRTGSRRRKSFSEEVPAAQKLAAWEYCSGSQEYFRCHDGSRFEEEEISELQPPEERIVSSFKPPVTFRPYRNLITTNGRIRFGARLPSRFSIKEALIL